MDLCITNSKRASNMITCKICSTTIQVRGFILDESSNMKELSTGFRCNAHILLCEECLNKLALFSEEYRILYEKIEAFTTALGNLLNVPT